MEEENINRELLMQEGGRYVSHCKGGGIRSEEIVWKCLDNSVESQTPIRLYRLSILLHFLNKNFGSSNPSMNFSSTG